MALKRIKPVVRAQGQVPAPISSAGFSKETLSALEQSAKRLKHVPARAFSKLEIEQVFKKIRDRS
ncbi:hypothetical protein [Massilia sp. TWR1-2-2]|uniref:hypothetical protein n=1 Tax=Massilia sp. TWR1-2-2 TaxID=2804584 RepID=UPI003CF32746